MAIIQTGAASSGNQIVDPTMQAARVSIRPPELLGAYQLCMTGTVATPNVNTYLYSFRFAPATTTNLCMIRRVEVSIAETVAITAGQIQTFMFVERNWTVAPTGGTNANWTNPGTGKMRSNMPTSAMAATGAIQISAGATGITLGTATEDSTPMAQMQQYGTAAASNITTTPVPLFQHQTGDYPLIFANQEGFTIKNGVAIATGTMQYTVTVEWFELAANSGSAISY